MKTFRKVLSLALCAALTASCIPAALADTGSTTEVDLENMKPSFYEVNANKWLYFGWENCDVKSISTIGGALFTAGSGAVRRYPDSGSGLRTPNYAALSDDEKQQVMKDTGLTEKQLTDYSDKGGFDQKTSAIRYTVTIGGTEYKPDETSAERRQNTKWYQADGYMNSPTSEWAAGNTGVDVKIQHVPGNVKHTDGRDGCEVFTQVTLTNSSAIEQTVVLNVGALSDFEVPMGSLKPDYESKDTSKYFYPQCDDNYSLYKVVIPAGENKKLDFAATVWNAMTPKELKAMGSFDEQYARTKAYYDDKLKDMSLPVSLPNEEMKNSYINSMIVMWETIVKSKWNEGLGYDNGTTDYQIRGSAGTRAKSVKNPADTMHGYYCYFPHDVPNMVEQFVRDGRFDLAMNILNSPNYQTLYMKEKHGGNLDAVPKYIIPYAALWQAMNDEQRAQYFTDDVKAKIKAVSREVISYISDGEDEGRDGSGNSTTLPGIKGIIQRSESLDNLPYDNLITDNFTAMHGLAAYRYLADAWGWNTADPDSTDAKDGEVAWTTAQMEPLNTALNGAMDAFMERHDIDWYMCALNDDSGFWRRHESGSILYDGNFICSSLMMSTFPWDAVLRGYDLGGTWADYFEKSMDNAVELKKKMSAKIPDGSWGAWWGHEYGSVYNVGQSVPMLYSDKYRTAVVESYEWLLKNQTAPFQWAESFDRGLSADDWTEAAIDYETWGLGFLRQGLLEAIASVKTDGTVIIGRGVPNEWMVSGTPIEWQNIFTNDGRKIEHLKLYAQDAKTIKLELTGDDAINDIVLDLAALKDNIAAVSTGTFDNENGTVTVDKATKELTVTLKHSIEIDNGVKTPTNVKATAKDRDINVTWDAMDNARGYVVQVTLSGEKIAEETVVDPTYTLKDAVPGMDYSFEVKALGSGLDESSYSDFVKAKTEVPTEAPSGDGSIVLNDTKVNKSTINANLTELGTLDWIQTGFGSRGVNDVIERKNQDKAYLQRFYTPYNNRVGDILLNTDIGYTYTWTDGTSQAAGTSKTALNLGVNFGNPASLTESATLWTVTAPATTLNGNKLILDWGAWQAKGHIDISLSDNSAAKQTIDFDITNPDEFHRYEIDYKVPERSNATLVVSCTIEQKYHQAGNTIIAAAMLQGDPVELDSLSVKAPTKAEYWIGDEELDLTDLEVTANYTFGDSRKLPASSYTVSGFDTSAAGEKEVTVSYTENGVTKTATFKVMVKAALLTKIEFTPPAKIVYKLGEAFEHSGMMTTAYYEGRSPRNVEASVIGFDANKLGKQDLTVSYTEGDVTKTAVLTVYVYELGDIDNDTHVDATDALMALQLAANKITVDAGQTKAANVDGEGNVTAADALMILKKATGAINDFPRGTGE